MNATEERRGDDAYDSWMEDQQEHFMSCPASRIVDAECECGWHRSAGRVEVSQTHQAEGHVQYVDPADGTIRDMAVPEANEIAQACPVCGGRGWMPVGFFTDLPRSVGRCSVRGR